MALLGSMQGLGNEISATFPRDKKGVGPGGSLPRDADRARRVTGAEAKQRYMMRSSRGLAVTPGVRPLFAIGLPSISWMSAVKSLGGALEMWLPTP